jgi:hypothetical protein
VALRDADRERIATRQVGALPPYGFVEDELKPRNARWA